MTLDIHKVRQTCTQAERKSDDAKRDVERIMNDFRNLGSGFTGDRLFSREYSSLDTAVKEAVRALEKVKQSVRDVARKA